MECSTGSFKGALTGCTTGFQWSEQWDGKFHKNLKGDFQGNFDGRLNGNLLEKAHWPPRQSISPRLYDRDYIVKTTGQVMVSWDGCLIGCSTGSSLELQ